MRFVAHYAGKVVGKRESERPYAYAVVVKSAMKPECVGKYVESPKASGEPYVLGWSMSEAGATKMACAIESKTPYYLVTEFVAIVPAEKVVVSA